jgi:hypothetical protein
VPISQEKRFFDQEPIGQRSNQDPDHGLLDLPGGEPPALRAIRSGIGEIVRGDPTTRSFSIVYLRNRRAWCH